MANIVKEGNTWIQVILDGSTNWTSNFLNFASCKFRPSAAGDNLVLREYPVDFGASTLATTNWPSIELYSSSGDTIGCLFKGKRRTKLHIPASECTFSMATSAIITFEVF
jgi:hypothetical protein